MLPGLNIQSTGTLYIYNTQRILRNTKRTTKYDTEILQPCISFRGIQSEIQMSSVTL